MEIVLTTEEQAVVDDIVATQIANEPDLTAEVLVRRMALKVIRQWVAEQRLALRQRLNNRMQLVLERNRPDDFHALDGLVSQLESAPSPDDEEEEATTQEPR